MKYIFILFLITVSCCSRKVIKLPSEPAKPKQEYRLLIIAQRLNDTKYDSITDEPMRKFRLSNDSLVWLRVSNHYFPSDTLWIKK